MSDKILKCSICSEKGRTREAETFCVECKDYYCSSCVNVHSKIPALRKHELLDRKDFRSEGTDGSLRSVPTKRCDIHQTEVVKMYCSDHDAVACALCIAFTHRSCENIHSISDELDNLYDSTEVNETKQQINHLKKFIEGIKIGREANVEGLKTSFDKAIASMKGFRQEIETTVDQMEGETMTELKKEFKRKVKKEKEEIQKAVEYIGFIDDIASNLKKSEGNKAQEFVSYKYYSTVIANAEELKTLVQQTPKPDIVSFTAHTNITAFLKQTKVLGRTVGITSADKLPGLKTSLYKIKKEREIDINLVNNIKLYSIKESCIINESCLLLTDSVNRLLLRFDMSTEKVNDFCSLGGNPVSICKINNKEAAVALNDNSIQFVSLGSELASVRKLLMEHYCFSMACANSLLYSCDGETNVYIYIMKREMVKNVSGEEIFHKCQLIAVNEEENTVFVADVEKGLVMLDSEGNYLCTLNYPNLSGPHRVCIDGRNVFICGCRSKNIVQIGRDYRLLGEVGELPTDSSSIEFDRHKTRLIITRSYLNNNITMMYLKHKKTHSRLGEM